MKVEVVDSLLSLRLFILILNCLLNLKMENFLRACIKMDFSSFVHTTDAYRTKVSAFIVVAGRPKGWKWSVRVMVDFVGVETEARGPQITRTLYISSAALSLILHPKARLYKGRSSYPHNRQYCSTQELNILL